MLQKGGVQSFTAASIETVSFEISLTKNAPERRRLHREARFIRPPGAEPVRTRKAAEKLLDHRTFAAQRRTWL